MPIYIAGKCRVETKEVIRNHLEKCTECKEMFQMMNEPIINVKENIVVNEQRKEESKGRMVMEGNSQNRVMKEYYKNLIFKYVFILLATYLITVFIIFSIVSMMRN